MLPDVSAAVAKAAIETGVAKNTITDFEEYKLSLIKRIGKESTIMRNLTQTAKSNPKRVVFAEGDRFEILRAAQIVKEEKIAIPIILGKKNKIQQMIKDYMLDLEDVEIVDTNAEEDSDRYNQFVDFIYSKRQRKGISKSDAKKLLRDRNYVGSCMVEFGYADAMISGMTKNYSQAIRPALELIGAEQGQKVASMYMMLTEKGPVFLGDTTVNLDPTSEDLVNITLQFNETIKKFKIEFINFFSFL